MNYRITQGRLAVEVPALRTHLDRLVQDIVETARLALSARPEDLPALAERPFGKAAIAALEGNPALRERIAARPTPSKDQLLRPEVADVRIEASPRLVSVRGLPPSKETWRDSLRAGGRPFEGLRPSPEVSMPQGDDPVTPSDRLEIRIRALQCLDETDPDGSDDHMVLSGLIVGPKGHVARVGELDLGLYDDPRDTDSGRQPASRVWPIPLHFGATDLAPAGKSGCVVTAVFALFEKDNGGLTAFVTNLLDHAGPKITEAVDQAVREAEKSLSPEIGSSVGAAVGKAIWGEAGEKIGKWVGYVLGHAWDAMVAWWEDDPFYPQVVTFELTSRMERFDGPGRLVTSPQRVVMYDDRLPSEAGGVYEITYDAVVSPDEDLDRTFVTPSVAAPAWGWVEVVARAPDATLHRKSLVGSHALPSQLGTITVGGVVRGRAAIAASNGRIDLLALGHDGGIWHKEVTGAAVQSNIQGWNPIGFSWGELRAIAAPAAVTVGDRLHVFAHAASGELLWREQRGDTWGPWRPIGGQLVGAPTAIRSDPDRVDVFVRGADGAVHTRSLRGDTWGEWQSLGGRIKGLPAAVSWGPGRRDVVVRGTDDAIYQKGQEHDGAWGEWTSLGGQFVGSPTVTSWGHERLDVFARGATGQVHHRAWAPGVGWHPAEWVALGGQIVGSPVALSAAVGRIDVFARSAEGPIVRRAWEGTWSPVDGWEVVSGAID